VKNILIVIFLTVVNFYGYSQVSHQKVVKLLKLEANKINKNLNDTFRYDFKVCPELIAWTKWDFPFNIDFNNQRLTRNLEKEGITDQKAIRFLRIITFHRILNQKDIDLNNQLNLFNKYQELIKSDNPSTFWKSTNDTLYLKVYENYISNFEKSNKVSGLLDTWNTKHTWVHNSIEYHGEFINTKDKNIMVKLLWIDQPLESYKLTKDVQLNDIKKNQNKRTNYNLRKPSKRYSGILY